MFTSEHPFALIGCGQMGQALARGWVTGDLSPDALIVLDRHPDKRRDFYADVPCRHVESLAELKKEGQPAALCLAMKPHQAQEVLHDIKAIFGDETPLLLSVLAGKPTDFYETILGRAAPIIRIMPNTPAAVGMGMSAAIANEQVSPKQREAVSRLMQSTGEMLWLEDEAMMHSFTAVAGSGPAYVFYLIECFIKEAIALGFDDAEARQMVAQTFAGAAKMVGTSETPVETLRTNVTSPNGTTQAGLEALMDEAVEQRVSQTLAAAKARSLELAQGN